jgi:hypothetical protein
VEVNKALGDAWLFSISFSTKGLVGILDLDCEEK